MPAKLDKCVQKLINEGHTEEEAWKICKKQLKAGKAQLKFEKAKRILTGQLIPKDFIFKKKEKIKKETLIDIDTEELEEE